jgi:hypothetical protein
VSAVASSGKQTPLSRRNSGNCDGRNYRADSISIVERLVGSWVLTITAPVREP